MLQLDGGLSVCVRDRDERVRLANKILERYAEGSKSLRLVLESLRASFTQAAFERRLIVFLATGSMTTSTHPRHHVILSGAALADLRSEFNY